MNYIKQLNAYYDWLQSNSLSSSAQLLYHTLLMVNNRCGWTEQFQRTNQSLCGVMGIDEKTLIKARNMLKQSNLIEFIPSKKKGEPTKYQILKLYGENVSTGEYTGKIPVQSISTGDCTGKIPVQNVSTGKIPAYSPVEPPAYSPVEPPVERPAINKHKQKHKYKYIYKESVSQLNTTENNSIKGLTDGLIGSLDINSIFSQAQIHLFDDDLQEFICSVMKELCEREELKHKIGMEHSEVIECFKKLRLENLDRAIGKYRAKVAVSDIQNPRLYFAKCLLSAISEAPLENIALEVVDDV